MTHQDAHDGRTDAKLSRRRFVAAAGAVAGGSLAGCPKPRTDSFEATPVVLPPAVRDDELGLAETTRYSHTLARGDPTGAVRVGITNEVGLYRRGPARGTPTLVEQFVGAVNATPGSGSAVNATPGSGSAIAVTASDLGVGSLPPLPYVVADAVVVGDDVGVTVPASLRGGDGIAPADVLVHWYPPGEATDPVTYAGDERGALVPSEAVFPSEAFFPSDAFSGASDAPRRVLVADAESLLSRVGVDALPDGARWVEPGEPVEMDRTAITASGNGWLPTGPLTGQSHAAAFDDALAVDPGGTTYGLAVLATPTATVAGRALNPLVGMSTGELLRSDAARRMLARAGVTDADAVEWLAGPALVGGDDGEVSTTLLGAETVVESFVGVVSGADGPWAVAVHVARATPADHVVAAGVHRRPVGTVDGGRAFVEGSGWGMDRLPRARRFTADAVGHLAASER